MNCVCWWRWRGCVCVSATEGHPVELVSGSVDNCVWVLKWPHLHWPLGVYTLFGHPFVMTKGKCMKTNSWVFLAYEYLQFYSKIFSFIIEILFNFYFQIINYTKFYSEFSFWPHPSCGLPCWKLTIIMLLVTHHQPLQLTWHILSSSNSFFSLLSLTHITQYLLHFLSPHSIWSLHQRDTVWNRRRISVVWFQYTGLGLLQSPWMGYLHLCRYHNYSLMLR